MLHILLGMQYISHSLLLSNNIQEHKLSSYHCLHRFCNLCGRYNIGCFFCNSHFDIICNIHWSLLRSILCSICICLKIRMSRSLWRIHSRYKKVLYLLFLNSRHYMSHKYQKLGGTVYTILWKVYSLRYKNHSHPQLCICSWKHISRNVEYQKNKNLDRLDSVNRLKM